MVIFLVERIKIPEDKLEFQSLLMHSKVSDFMATPPITLTKNATMADAKAVMKAKKISGIPVAGLLPFQDSWRE